jgi:hypothetical protein
MNRYKIKQIAQVCSLLRQQPGLLFGKFATGFHPLTFLINVGYSDGYLAGTGVVLLIRVDAASKYTTQLMRAPIKLSIVEQRSVMIVQLDSNWNVVNIKGLHCGKSYVNLKASS